MLNYRLFDKKILYTKINFPKKIGYSILKSPDLTYHDVFNPTAILQCFLFYCFLNVIVIK